MIAVVVPTLDEAEHIGPLLARLLEDGPDGIEVLVADGGSRDGTRAIVAAAASGDRRVRLIDNPDRIQAAGVNLAVRAADPRCDVVVRVDAHATYPPRYVGRLVETLAATGADSVVVRLKAGGEGVFQRGVAAAGNSRFGTGGASHRVGGRSGWIDHGHHAVMRRAAFEALGGYDPTFVANEDAEFDVRLRRSGGRIWFASEIEVDYRPRRSAGALSRQYFRYGAGRARTLLLHGSPPAPRQLAPPLLVLVLVVALVGAAASPWTLLAPLAYLAGMTGVAATLAVRAGDPAVLTAAAAFPVMHLSWGGGFIGVLAGRILPRPKGTGRS